MSNRDRILETALQLMNEAGAQATGTSRIAQVLGVSPGNLYYHFKNREDIVRALFADLERAFRAILADDIDLPISPARFADFYLRSFDLVWTYRFFFGALHHLLRRDAELAAQYRALQDWALVALEAIVRQLVADGSMTAPRRKDGLHSIALNTWLIWINWVRFVQISGRETLGKGDLVKGVGQIFDLLAPYLVEDFEAAARRVLTRALKSQQLA